MPKTRIINNFNWKIGGAAGEGIMAAGLIFSKSAAHAGLSIYDYAEYPSLIKGGHNSYQVRVAAEPVHFILNQVDLLVAFNSETIDRHKNELSPKAGVIYDSEKVKINKNLKNKKIFPVPLEKIALRFKNPLTKNSAAIGVSFALLDFDFEILSKVIFDFFGRKGERVAKINVQAAKAGWDHALKNFKNDFDFKLQKRKEEKKMVMTGNEAISLGIQAAGCKFFSAYPMTPSTSILHFLKSKEKDYGMIVIQPEDEISAIGMAIGASYAGVRAATTTSGGGFSLKVEHLGLSAMTEIPLVVIECQRPGPSTGMPTWTEQGDLRFLIHAGQGDFPKVVLAPGDVREAFYLTTFAFNLAEKYQIPVFVMSDKLLSENHQLIETLDLKKIKIERGKILRENDLTKIKNYFRYKKSIDGVSPRSLPGEKGGFFDANSDEHDEYGFSGEDIKTRKAMMEKRFKKMQTLSKELDSPKIYGEKSAKTTLVAFGSNKQPVLEALKLFEMKGREIRFLHLNVLWPFPTRFVKKIFDSSKKVVVIENNISGQLSGLIREMTGCQAHGSLLKYDGRPFWPEEIYEGV